MNRRTTYSRPPGVKCSRFLEALDALGSEAQISRLMCHAGEQLRTGSRPAHPAILRAHSHDGPAGAIDTFCSTSNMVSPCALIRPRSSKIAFTMTGARPEARLVQHQQPGPGHQPATDRAHLLLAARQRPRELTAPLARSRGNRSEHALERLGAARAGRRRARRQLEVLQHGHRREELAALRHVRDAAATISAEVTGRRAAGRPTRCARGGAAAGRRPRAAWWSCRRRWRRSAPPSRRRAPRARRRATAVRSP